MQIQLDDRIGETKFKWAEALWLPKWKVHVFPSEDQSKNIEKIAAKLDYVSRLFKPEMLRITSWLRPENYNSWVGKYGVGGAFKSSHMLGLAVDFYFEGIDCDLVRAQLEPKLEELRIRMEKKPKATWVHIDARDVGPGGRYFEP